MELRFLLARKPHLGRRDRLIERITLVMLDEFDEALQLFRLHGRADELLQVAEILQRLEDRELVPAAEIGVVAGRHVEQLIEAAELRALADQRRNDVVDDAEVEMIAGHADAGMADWHGGQLSRMAFETDDRIVRRAAAEIGDQHGRIPLQALGDVEGGCDRLVNEMDFRKIEGGQRVVVALQRQRLVRRRAGKAHGAADDEPVVAAFPAIAGIIGDAVDEGTHQVFEILPLGEDQRALEKAAGGKGLDRLQETHVAGIVDEFADRSMAGLDLQRRGTELRVLHEGQRRAHRVAGAGGTGEGERLRRLALRGRQHGIGRPEIEAECLGHVVSPGRRCPARGRTAKRDGLAALAMRNVWELAGGPRCALARMRWARRTGLRQKQGEAVR